MRKYLYGISAFVLAFVILSVSVLRSGSVSRVYGSSNLPVVATNPPNPTPTINYSLPYPGGILPDNWLWYLKAARDRIQYMVTTDPLKRAELTLLFSDKRLQSSLTLFVNEKPDIAVTTLSKGEKYLQESWSNEEAARAKGTDTTDFLTKLANASLKHRQMIEEEIMPLAPEDVKPEIVKAEDYSKNTYKDSRNILGSKGITVPKDPFNGQ